MTVRVTNERGHLVIDIRTRGPDGEPVRERRRAPDGVRSESSAKRWGEARQAHLAHNGAAEEDAPPAPTFAEFGKRWMLEYVKAEGLKPSTVDTYDRYLRLHLTTWNAMRLDEIGAPEIQKLKLALAHLSAKTRRDVLTCAVSILRAAEKWEEITRAPEIDMPSVPERAMEFYDFAEWDALLIGAAKAGPMVLTAMLLGGDAGLRRGELVALEQSDAGNGAVTISRNEWEGEAGTTKGNKPRRVPMTARLAAAVDAVRHLRGKRLLWQTNGRPVGVTTLQSWMETACRRAGLPESRNLHKLRHTFCSHLAMRGAPARVIQELAGHADLKTTMRYMHLAEGSREDAISLLERGAGGERISQSSKT
jgi:integrase